MSNTNKTEEKLFTQAEVDAIIKERLERERKRYNADADTMETLQKELITVKGELENVKAQADGKAKAYKAEKIKNGLVEMLSKKHVIEPGQISMLLLNSCDLDDNGNFVFHDGDTDIPLQEKVDDWAKKNLWAIKNTQHAGSGANSGISSLKWPAEQKRNPLRAAFGLPREGYK